MPCRAWVYPFIPMGHYSCKTFCHGCTMFVLPYFRYDKWVVQKKRQYRGSEPFPKWVILQRVIRKIMPRSGIAHNMGHFGEGSGF